MNCTFISSNKGKCYIVKSIPNANIKFDDLFVLFPFMILSKRGTFLQTVILRSEFGFRRFQDIVLIDKRKLNQDSQICVVVNGIKTGNVFHQFLGAFFVYPVVNTSIRIKSPFKVLNSRSYSVSEFIVS